MDNNDNIQKIELNLISIEDNENTENKLFQYKYCDKIELVKKINKIKKKEYLINIFKIISENTDNYTENNNGIFIFFHNLDNEVYHKIENYVNLIYKIHHETNITNIFNSDTQLLNSENINDSDNKSENNDNELSNKEKVLLRRKKYKRYLDYNQY
jgi:hypothetical protein